MDESKLSTIGQIEAFLGASEQVTFAAHAGDTERYAHINTVLRRFDYPRRNKRDRGVLFAYLRHTSGYSRSQLTRLVRQWVGNRLAPVPLAKHYAMPVAPFARKYTPGDVALLVETDRAHEDVCGPAIVLLLDRAYSVYGDARYERLSKLSVSHLYNLRRMRHPQLWFCQGSVRGVRPRLRGGFLLPRPGRLPVVQHPAHGRRPPRIWSITSCRRCHYGSGSFPCPSGCAISCTTM